MAGEQGPITVRDYYQNVALIMADSMTVGGLVWKFNLYGPHPSG
jgi:hypothetical protein